MARFIRTSLLLMVVSLALTASQALAAYGTMNYQGKLTTAADVAVPDGAYPAQFTLWTDSLLGTQVWLEQQDINVSKGLFTAELGKIVSLADVFSQYPSTDLYLQVQVTISGSAQILRPRMRIATVPHAQLSRRLVDDTITTTGTAIVAGAAPDSATRLVMSTEDFGDTDSLVLSTERKSGSVILTDRMGQEVMRTGMHVDGEGDSILFDQSVLDNGSLVSGYSAKTGKTGSTKRLVFVSGSSGSSSREYANADSAGSESQAKEGTVTVKYTAKAGKTGSTKRMIYQDGGDEASSSESADADSVVFEQSYKTATTEIKYKAKQGTTGSAKRESASSGGDSSSSDEFTDPDSLVSADTIKQNGDVLVVYKATTGKTGKAISSLRVIPGTGSESETNEFESADSAVSEETYDVNGQQLALYKAKQGKSGSASGKRLIGGGSSSSSDDTHTPDSIAHADSISNGSDLSSSASTLTGAKLAIKLNFGRTGSSSISTRQQTVDSTVSSDSVSSGAQYLTYKAKQGKTGSAKQSRIVDDNDESSSSERMTADSIITVHSVNDNAGSYATYTAKTGKTGKTKDCKIVDNDDESSSSERMAVDSIVHEENSIVNGIVVTQYTAKQGSTGRTKRTMQNSGGHEYASVEEVDNNGSRLYLTTDNGGGTPLDTGFYADDNGTVYAGAKVGIGVSTPTHPLQLSSGAHCTAGGTFTNASDVNLKENFQPVDEAALLDKVEQLPITQWNYKNEGDNVTHIGPTAQDFKAIFGVGDNDKSISTIDPAGIALAAIKELRKENRDLKSENAELKKRLDDLQKMVEALAAKR